MEFVYGLASASVALLTAYWAYRKSVKVDAVVAQTGATSETRAGTAQIFEGLNRLIDNVQEDNTDLRAEARLCQARVARLILERDLLSKEVNRLHRKYGENGDTD